MSATGSCQDVSTWEFLNAPRALEALARVDRCAKPFVQFLQRGSDKEPNYCNLVLQGGGTLGIAHIGAIHALEHAGIRFAGVAGTSAGAICALLIAACRKHWHEATAVKLLPILLELPADDFIDGPYHVRRVVKRLIPKTSDVDWLDLLPSLVVAAWKLRTDHGLNSGERFLIWLEGHLAEFGINCEDDLLQTVASGAPANLPVTLERARSLCKVFATALPHGVKMTFPEDSWVLDVSVRERSPAIYARASMSVPIFFEPLDLAIDQKRWGEYIKSLQYPDPEADRKYESVQYVRFSDGGLVSNFPIDAFDTKVAEPPWIAALPTVGVTLLPAPSIASATPEGGYTGLIQLLGGLLNAARRSRDREAEMRMTTPQRGLVVPVATGGHNWLDFTLGQDAMLDLFCLGIEGVADVLEKE